MNHADRAHLVSLTAAAMLLAFAGGCGGSGSSASATGPAAHPVTAESFVDPNPAPAAVAGPAAAPATAAPVATPANAAAAARHNTAPVLAGPLPAEAVLDTQTKVGQPPMSGPATPTSPVPVVLESLIGQVNGRPVFASEILEPLDAQLRAAAREAKTRAAWQEAVRRPIVDSLLRIIKDELILAEARAALTPEQKQGLFQFLSKIQEDVVSQQKGSAVAADEALRSGTGLTLQEAAKDRLDRELIANEIRQRISPRVIVSWRQIQQEYERNHDKFNPKPIAQFRLVSAPASKPAVVEQIKSELAAGKPFNDIAESDLSTLSRADGGLIPPVTLTGDPKQTLFQFPELDAAAKPLTPGQSAGPVAIRGYTYWVKLESIDQPPSITLYDAQLEIEHELRERRFETETDRYFDRLRKRGNVSKISDMASRVYIIAEQRYLNPSLQ